MSFSILTVKSYNKRNENSPKFTVEKWRAVIDEDPELIWAEDTELAKKYEEKELSINKSEDRNRLNAYYEINKKYGYGNVRFYFHPDFITADCERQTLKRVEKMWEVAGKLDGFLFKRGSRFTENKLFKLRDKVTLKK